MPHRHDFEKGFFANQAITLQVEIFQDALFLSGLGMNEIPAHRAPKFVLLIKIKLFEMDIEALVQHHTASGLATCSAVLPKRLVRWAYHTSALLNSLSSNSGHNTSEKYNSV